MSEPGGMLCSNYRSEVLALINAIETINFFWKEKLKKAVLLTESLSDLQAPMSGEPDAAQEKLTENIGTHVESTCIVLQGIPAYTGIREMQQQISLQKKEGKSSNPPPHLSYKELKKTSYPQLKKTTTKLSSTSKLEDTTQTRTHSISCHDTNRPPTFGPEQATAD